jgi:hypothetical protein
MRLALLFSIAFTSLMVRSQTDLNEPIYTIEELVEKDPDRGLSKFPIVHSEKYPEAAYKINVLLHYKVLNKIFGNEEESIFSKVHPKEEEISGQTEFSFSINTNNHSFFSITITYLGTGAYSEYFNEEFNFFASTGTHITLNDILTEDGLSNVGGMVNKACLDSLDKALQQIDPEGEYADEQRELYKDCKSRFKNSGQLNLSNFRISNGGVTFSKDRCSNHAMAALDDLWIFNIEFSFEELQAHLSKNALNSINDGTVDLCLITYIADKIFIGSINGEYPITMIFNDYSRGDGEQSIRGVYWYDRVKKRIGLTGKAEALTSLITKVELEEIVRARKTANITGVFGCGEYMARWIKVGELGKLPLVVKL